MAAPTIFDEIRADLAVIKWMLGVLIVGMIALVMKAFYFALERAL